jgi:glycosyltransferase involved in cell wall biosynthesis
MTSYPGSSTTASSDLPEEISIYAVPPSSGPIDGYSYAGLKIVKALNRLGIRTPWRDDSSPVSISFCQPEWYSHAEGQFRIGYTPWESTVIPDWWPKHMNEMDLMWTTSRFCKRVFEENGVEKDILVVPHGIDPDDFTVRRRVEEEPFYFIHMGEPATRKGGQLVVDAFLELFNRDPSTRLIVKANGWAECRLREPFGPVDAHPQITLIKERMSVHELNALLGRCHAMIYPSNGEGFGLIPFQAIATGMPTAAVVWGGIEEFGEFCIPIDHTVGPSQHDYHLGEWAHPSYESILDVMARIRRDYERYAARAYEDALIIHQKWLWEDIISRAISESL